MTMIRRTIWGLVAALALLAMYLTLWHPEIIVGGLKNDAVVLPSSDKCYSNCTDPNRPSFDACGNEYDYLGNLIKPGTGCQASTPAITPVQPIATPDVTNFQGK